MNKSMRTNCATVAFDPLGAQQDPNLTEEVAALMQGPDEPAHVGLEPIDEAGVRHRRLRRT